MPGIAVTKTYKLFINGAFPRSESGRSWPIAGKSIAGKAGDVYAHLCLASRKDLRDTVEAARAAQAKWAGATAYNRGQVLYRLAEMMQGKQDELADAIASVPALPGAGGKTSGKARGKTAGKAIGKRAATAGAVKQLSPRQEVSLSIDRVVHYAGWCDKYSQLLGCHNPVAGQFYNFTLPEATGVVVVVCPDAFPLLALVSMMLPVLVPGNAAIVVPSEANPVVSMVLAEGLATSDLPAGVANILTGKRSELLPHIASHREIDGVLASATGSDAQMLREGIAENLKRVTIVEDRLLRDGQFADAGAQGLAWIEKGVEFKTIWHPAIA
jgi:acyl-CoA reductase-like NAD-dependent aldehyde dehydrogenase